VLHHLTQVRDSRHTQTHDEVSYPEEYNLSPLARCPTFLAGVLLSVLLQEKQKKKTRETTTKLKPNGL
jgi:hypothetical protein